MTVSILINNYNYGHFLDECLLSIQNQTVKPDEVILYDDGSTDNSLEVVSKYNFVKVIANKNFGEKPSFNQGNAINQAFKESTGQIIILLDSDDFFDPKKVESVKYHFENNKSLVFLQDSYFEYYSKDNFSKKSNTKIDFNYLKLYQRENWTAYFNPTSMMSFSRDYLEKQLPITVDDFWRVWPDVRLSRIAPYFGDICMLDEAYTYYRRHLSSDSATMNASHQKALENQIAHHEYINKKLISLGFEKINFTKSIPFKRYKLRLKYPEKVIRYILLPSKIIHFIKNIFT
ncbi:MAG: glycosyltransferase family 2 protein [Flavobacteriia bacterium]|nr:glycosyltransferase family 2 protein [Flavobacteriia bacterium]